MSDSDNVETGGEFLYRRVELHEQHIVSLKRVAEVIVVQDQDSLVQLDLRARS